LILPENDLHVPVEYNSVVYRGLTPREMEFNLRFRKEALQAGYESASDARELIEICSRDVLFFVNTFCWLLETRDAAKWQIGKRLPNKRQIPFITRPYQDEGILRSVANLGKRDIVVPKSRETGVTWLYVSMAAWDWLFHEETHIGFASKDENTVDNPADPDSLMAKLDFLLSRLPIWMLDAKKDLVRNVTSHSFLNQRNGSSIVGYAATADLGRGGRKNWWLMDEFHFFGAGDDERAMESTQGSTRCRVLVSTVNRIRGQSGSFFNWATSEELDREVIVIDWKDDPEKRLGMYTSDRVGQSDVFNLRIVDEIFWSGYRRDNGLYAHPMETGKDYPFILDGKTRSLYYDTEWRRSTPQAMAAELDRNFAGATSQVCDQSVLDTAMMKADDYEFTADVRRDDAQEDRPYVVDPYQDGNLGLWCEMENNRPIKDVYAVGCDISAGTGGAWSSYSHIAVFSRKTGKQVAEWRSNRFNPLEFADLAMAVCRWFHNAYLIPECNGPLGTMFVNRVTEVGYYNLFYARKSQEDATALAGSRPGYWNNDGGNRILVQLTQALREGRAVVKSKIALREMGRYIYRDGKCVHSSVKDESDHGARGKSHGDAAIGTAVAWHGILDLPEIRKEAPPDEVVRGSFLERQMRAKQEREARERHRTYWSA
jgi:hypothetical protein